MLARLGVMESRSWQRPAALGVVAIIAFLVLPLPSNGEVFCHPNIFGGQDCTTPEGHSSSTPKGTIESRPNIFGGKDYRLPSGDRIESHPNIFGGQDFRHPDGHVVECRQNIFGGADCR